MPIQIFYLWGKRRSNHASMAANQRCRFLGGAIACATASAWSVPKPSTGVEGFGSGPHSFCRPEPLQAPQKVFFQGLCGSSAAEPIHVIRPVPLHAPQPTLL